jgi:hypothetical protein
MSISESKELQNIEHVEALPTGDREKDQAVLYDAHIDVSGVDQAKLIQKIDWRLLPWLSFLYLLSFLDRTSIGNAKVHHPIPSLGVIFDGYFRQLYHMVTDLRLTDKEYLLCLTVFYLSYAFFEARLSSPCGSS